VGSVRARCRVCSREADHRGKVGATYGLSTGEYDAMLAKQGGRCAICCLRPRSKRLAVDHDHKTGRVRGLLCGSCNRRLLGAAHDDPAILRRALGYLEGEEVATFDAIVDAAGGGRVILLVDRGAERYPTPGTVVRVGEA
jgi:hypothetical protein